MNTLSKRKQLGYMDCIDKLAMCYDTEEHIDIDEIEQKLERKQNFINYAKERLAMKKSNKNTVVVENTNNEGVVKMEENRINNVSNGVDSVGNDRDERVISIDKSTERFNIEGIEKIVEEVMTGLQVVNSLTLENDAKKQAKVDFLNEYDITVLGAVAKSLLLSIQVNEDPMVKNVGDFLKIDSLVTSAKFELWAKTNQPNDKLIMKAQELGISDLSGSYYDLHRRVQLKQYPITESMINAYSKNLVELGKSMKETIKLVSTAKASLTFFELSEILREQNEVIICSENQFKYIISLQKRLGVLASQTKPSKAVASKLVYSLQKQIVMKENNIFGTETALNEFLETESKAKKTSKSKIVSDMINQLTAERNAEYFKSEEVQTAIQRKLAMQGLL